MRAWGARDLVALASEPVFTALDRSRAADLGLMTNECQLASYLTS